jgi:hypothetical protein
LELHLRRLGAYDLSVWLEPQVRPDLDAKELAQAHLWSKANSSANLACHLVLTVLQLACDSPTRPCSTSSQDMLAYESPVDPSSPCSSSATAFRAAMQAAPSLASHQHPASSHAHHAALHPSPPPLPAARLSTAAARTPGSQVYPASHAQPEVLSIPHQAL